MTSPAVTVIIPTQRRPDMLREAAASVLAQTFRDLELIVVANAATAETMAAAGALAADPRVRVLALARGNLAGARNAGVAAARGEWVAFLDDDDAWFADKLERQLAAAQETGADFVNCDFLACGADGLSGPQHLWPPPELDFAQGFILQNFGAAGGSGALIKTAAMRAIGGFDARLRACEDWDAWRRLAARYPTHFLAAPLVTIRRHSDSMSQTMRMAWWEFCHRVKMTFDTPRRLRPMLLRGWREMFWREAANAYAFLNRASGGRVQIVYRSIRGRVR